MSELTEKQKEEYLQDRRQWKERFFSTPLYKRFFKQVEHINKRLTLGLLGKILNVKSFEGKFSLDDLSSVLILRTDAIGDMIATSPLWRILKRRKPSLKIGVAGSFRNLEILRADTDIDHLYNFSIADAALRRTEFSRARAENYDLVIACKFDQKTKSSILARKASKNGYIATIIPESTEPHHKIISKPVKLPKSEKPIPMILQLQHLLENTIDLTIEPEERRPSIIIDKNILEKTKAEIESILHRTGTNQYLVINTESATEFREWGFENNYHLAKAITLQHPEMMIFLTSSPLREVSLKRFLAVQDEHPKIRYFPTKDLYELATLIRYSMLVISPDTSVIHFATAEAKPTIGFYVQHNPWLPFRVPAKVFIPEMGKPVSSIPFDLVKEGVIELLETAISAPNKVDIFWCEEPLRIERIIPD